MFYYKPFNYSLDGTFTRSSVAWHLDDAGFIVESAADVKRLVDRVGIAWVWIEGARENFIDDPLDCTTVEWTDPAAGSANTTTPTGDDATVGFAQEPADVVSQIVYGGSIGPLHAASAFVRNTSAAQGTINLDVTNSSPAGSVTVVAASATTTPGFFTRAKKQALDMTAAGSKSLVLDGETDDTFIWGAQLESGPGLTADARFVSQPILVRGVRTTERYVLSAITQAMIDANPRSIRVSFEPECPSSAFNEFTSQVIAYVDTGNTATSIIVWLEGTGSGAVRVNAGYDTGTQVSSGSLTFGDGQRLTAELVLATGQLVITGASTGNGTFTAGVYALAVDASIYVGTRPDGSLPAYALIAPIELGYDAITVTGFEQLTLNSARVTFSIDVLKFDPNGILDALNPEHYIITGTPGLPRVQSVGRGDADNEVILFFDAPIAGGALVRLSVQDIVGALLPVGVDEGARAVLDMVPQSGGVLDTVLETTEPGAAANGQPSFSTWQWSGDPLLRPGIGGVEIVADIPARPWINFWFIVGVTTVADMEAALEAVAGHLVRVKIPGSAHEFAATDEFEQMEFQGGIDVPTQQFIAFGDEVSPAIAAELAIQRVDIANPQTPYDAGTSTLGTIPVTDAGDLENDSGRTGLRKRIYRRLSTVRDGFFHLDGYGLRPQDKSPITPTSLRQLQLNIEEQVLAEQGVVAVRVRMSEIAIGVVAVRLTVQDDNGAFEMTGTLDFTGE